MLAVVVVRVVVVAVVTVGVFMMFMVWKRGKKKIKLSVKECIMTSNLSKQVELEWPTVPERTMSSKDSLVR